MVNSVMGPIDPKELGFTLMHEHIICVNPSMSQAFPDWINRRETISKAIKQLTETKQHGLKTIVDATPFNLGRDIRLLREVAEKTDIQIIASTGFYHVDEPFLIGWDIDHLVNLLLSEIENGIQGTNIKPGVIKCASKTEITKTNEKLLRVAARAHRQSGLPVITHSPIINEIGLAQQEILFDEGVDPKKLVIGHCGDTANVDYLESILECGCYIGLDRFGLDVILPMDSRVDVCVELCEKGYEQQIMVSHDYNVFIDFWPKEVFPARARKEEKASRWNFNHIFEDIIPRLREKGVTDRQVETITVENPMRIFQ